MSSRYSTTSSRRSTTSTSVIFGRHIRPCPPRYPPGHESADTVHSGRVGGNGSRATLARLARVLVTRRLPEGGLDPLMAAGHEIVQRADDDPFSPAELATAVADVEALVCLIT